jgi:2-keto-myo-inositol isomerase
MRPCINQDTLRTTETSRFLEVARSSGFDSVEFTMDKLDEYLQEHSTDELKSLLVETNLEPVSINGPENFSFRTEQELLPILERTKRMSRVCTTINCPMLIAVPSFVKENKSHDEIVSETAKSLKRVIDACDSGIKVGLEFLGIRNCSVADLSTATEVVRKVGGDRVGLIIDTFHVYLSRATSADLTRIPFRELFLVHINDSEQLPIEQLADGNRVFPGEGVIDLEGYIKALSSIGYDEFLSVELLREQYWTEDPLKIAIRARRSLDRYLS